MKSNSSEFISRKPPPAWPGWVLLLALLAFIPLAVAGNSTAYDSQIKQAAGNNGVDPALLKAVVAQESGFNPNAGSSKGAYGLGQLMPGTAQQMGYSPADMADPQKNLDATAKYLKQQLDKYNGNVPLALAAYNAGPGAVAKYHNQIPPYPETQNYVKRVSAYYQKYKQNFDDPTGVPNVPSGAPGAAQGGVPPFNNDMTGLGLELSKFFEELFQQLMLVSDKITGNLAAEGTQLASILTVIAVIWTGLQGALKQDPINKLMARLIEVLMICAIALMLVQGSFYKDYVQQPIDNTFCAVAGRFSHVAESTDCKAMNSSVKRMTAGLTEGMMNIWGSVTEEAHAINPFTDWYTAVKALAPWNFANTVALWTLLLIDGIVKIFVIFTLMGALLTCFVVYAMSVILSSIGFALGPVFIPWMILRTSQDFTKSWANFVLIAEMYKVMVVLIMSIANPVITKILSLVCQSGGPGVGGDTTCQAPAKLTAGTDAYSFGKLILQVDIPLVIMAVLLAHFLKHAGQWAEGIINGGASTSMSVRWF